MADLEQAAGVGDDEALVASAKRNPAAFAPLYQKYVRPIYGYCYQRLGTHELTEDATHQVFVKALAALPRYRADSFRGWLFTIAHNVVADAYRRRPTMPLDAAWDVPDSGWSPEDAALMADGGHRLQRLLAQLTPDQREVVELRLAGLNGPEIAIVLGRRAGAVRATQLRAYRRLRELLTEEGADR
jgi:RNA polymerase sigma-70 factor (ECF subfamily)